MRGLLTSLLIALTSSNAFAAIKLCNEFEHTVRFAVAFQTRDGWVSEGWVTVPSKSCQSDPKHSDLTEFYWRGETDWIKSRDGRAKTKWSWGKMRSFSVKDAPFAFTNADQKVRGGRLEAFAGPVTVKSPSLVEVTVLIVDAKTTMTSLSSETAALKADPDYRACADLSGVEAVAACARAIGSGKFKGALLADLHINRGAERSQAKDFDGALADFDEAIRIDSTKPLAFANRASVHYGKNHYDAAIQDLDKAITLNPKYLRAYADRGDSYLKNGDLSRAIEDYKMALALSPDDKQKAAIEKALSNAYVDRGVEQKDASAELADYDEALRIDPDHTIALNNRAAAYTSKREYDKAIQDLDRAIKLKQDYARAYSNRGDAYRGKGDRAQAVSDYKEALQSRPDDALRKQIQKALDELESQ
jgi:tetratricopeptide (TPR) repeat protein